MAGKPVSQAGADIGRRVAAIGLAAEKSRNSSVQASLMTAKRIHEGVIRRDSGGDMRLSGVNRAKGRAGNSKVGARFNMTGNGIGEIKATGPLQIINNDTSGHVIRSAYSKGRARRGFVGPTLPGQFRGDRKAVLNIPGIGFRRSARHPGTKGKDTWQRGKRLAAKPIRTTMTKATFATIAGAFKAT